MRHFDTQTELTRRLARDGHVVWVRLSGGSMAPGLCSGDNVGIEGVDPTDVSAGDVIAYRRGGRIISHVLCFSVGWGRRRWLFLKGAANDRGDPPVRWEDVVGRVTGVRRDNEVRLLERADVGIHWPWDGIATVLRAVRGLLPAARLVKGVAR